MAPSHSHSDACHNHGHHHYLGEQTELIFALISGALLLLGWVGELVTSIPFGFSLTCFLGAYFFGGYYATLESLEKLKAAKFEIDFLMIVAAIGSAILGGWAEGSLLLFLFSLGHALEHYAMGRARRAIEALAELAPRFAVVRRGQQTEEVPVETLTLNDIVLVKPNERIAVDGFVLDGVSSVDQAPITGESLPVDKSPVEDAERARQNPAKIDSEHCVFAGTINGNGAMEIQVTHLAADSTLASVVRMVNEAESQRSPTQRFTDRFQRYYVPCVLLFVLALLFAGYVIEEPFSDSFYRAMAVLIAASPCALAISTPSAVLSGVARAARDGVLIKGGGPLENLGRLRSLAFDKTGTLTEGRPQLTDALTHGDTTREELLQIAMAVESLSDHPLARAVVVAAKELVPPPSYQALDLQSLTGKGVQAQIDGEPVFIGKRVLFSDLNELDIPETLNEQVAALEAAGRTTMIVRRGPRFLGTIGLMDTPRPTAPKTIDRLRELGIGHMMIISGDNQVVADAVAQQVGIDQAVGNLMPQDKVDFVRQLAADGEVGMVGDGVNDAPAMASATVGIAMGAAGSAVALETADVALMADNLDRLSFAIGLGRQTSTTIKQNLWLSLGMVAVLVPASLFGLQIGLAVVFHEGSTIAVVFNALRLLMYQEPKT